MKRRARAYIADEFEGEATEEIMLGLPTAQGEPQQWAVYRVRGKGLLGELDYTYVGVVVERPPPDEQEAGSDGG